MDNLPIQKS